MSVRNSQCYRPSIRKQTNRPRSPYGAARRSFASKCRATASHSDWCEWEPDTDRPRPANRGVLFGRDDTHPAHSSPERCEPSDLRIATGRLHGRAIGSPDGYSCSRQKRAPRCLRARQRPETRWAANDPARSTESRRSRIEARVSRGTRTSKSNRATTGDISATRLSPSRTLLEATARPAGAARSRRSTGESAGGARRNTSLRRQRRLRRRLASTWPRVY